MPKIPYAEEGEETPEATVIYKEIKKVFGFVPNFVKLMGHSSGATQTMGAFVDAYFNKLNIKPRLREIAFLTVSRANKCTYCQAHHTAMAKKAGLTDEQIGVLGPNGFENTLLTEAERAVVRFAYETTKEVEASDEAIESLKKYFSTQEIAEIAYITASANFLQRIGKNLGVELEEEATF
ncbi:MAG: hypothetical protein COB53_01215 [Elusimicrobia bacterium]|nr:MAG: hypothetical protein COB53_01215 [Elusimicrobiota bacterium]